MNIKNKVPTVAIVGRPNVGKSSLFNLIIGRRMAIVHEESGVTRDRVAAPVVWYGKHFQLIDTGGLGVLNKEKKKVDMWDSYIRSQVEAAIEGADILLFVVDMQAGFVPLDSEVAERLRASSNKVILVANKADNMKMIRETVDFSPLGFDNIYPVSCLHKHGIDDILEEALADIPVTGYEEKKENPFKVAVVGRPNVGKSSIINALLGEERVMVSDVAGTTRDSVNTDFELTFKGEQIPAQLIDTAGLRKRAKVDGLIEHFSMMRTDTSIKQADLVLLVIEAKPDGLTAQDRHIAKMISEAGKACIIVANKWDICEEGHKQVQVLDEIRRTLPQMTYAPVVFTCALTSYNFNKMLDSVAVVMEQMEIQIPTSVLNRIISDAIDRNSPPVIGRLPFKVYYATMIGNAPPRFSLFVNNSKLCAPHFLSYLNNYIRKHFDFIGLPIKIHLKNRPKPKLEEKLEQQGGEAATTPSGKPKRQRRAKQTSKTKAKYKAQFKTKSNSKKALPKGANKPKRSKPCKDKCKVSRKNKKRR
jgi:GTP-binding protein